MERFYIGYGHKSIGDCGSTTIFVEGISELAAKAIQDWPLYSGQQTSTRYIDFADQPLADPLGSAGSGAILKRWMDFYTGSIGLVREDLRRQFPAGPGAGEDHERALKARSFDIMRAFLPAGITTQLSWHTNLRQAGDKLALLRHHPLPEVRELADQIARELQTHYPHSFTGKLYAEQEAWREELQRTTCYRDADWPVAEVPRQALLPGGCTTCDWRTLAASAGLPNPALSGQVAPVRRVAVAPGSTEPYFVSEACFDREELAGYEALLGTRPVKTDLPRFLDAAGRIRARFVLDYGSFRDLQRHRQGATRMPLLGTRHGFESWYLAALPDRLREQALVLIREQVTAIAALDCPPEMRQYYTALGFRVVCDHSWGLPAAVYIAEIRSGASVHPTLRRIALALGEALLEALPGLALHLDRSEDAFQPERGRQDIRERT